MQQWNPYTYWQNTAYNSYTAGSPFTQTFDYNHQPTAVSTADGSSDTPLPPGVDAQSNTGAATTVTTTSTTIGLQSAWSYPAMSQTTAYAVPTSTTPLRSPYLHTFDAQAPLLPNGSTFPAYNYNWTMPPYGYYPYTGAMPWNFAAAPMSTQPIHSATSTNLSGSTRFPTATSTLQPLIPQNSTASTIESLKQPPSTLQSNGTKEQWSDELKDYVQRAFCSIDTKEEKDQMERILKEKLEYIFRNNIKVDWTKENIPIVPSKAFANIQQSRTMASTINSLRPVQLPTGTRGGLRSTGPARGSGLRLPIGVLPRGGTARNLFPTNAVAPKRKFPSPSKNVDDIVSPQPRFSRRMDSHHRRSRSRSTSSSRSPRSPSPPVAANRYRGRDRQRVSRSRSRSSSRHRKTDNRDVYINLEPDSPHSRTSSQKTARRKYKSRRGKLSHQSSGHTPPPSASETTGRGRGRGGAPSKRGGRGGSTAAYQASAATLSSRADRFKDHLSKSTLDGTGSIGRSTSQVLNLFDDRDELSADFESCQIVGTMTDLEKSYLRLTRAPEPHEVRSHAVLKQSLEHVKQKWLQKSDYHWACEQFKSIRQDLTVQGIDDDLAVAVYETHADAALDAGDFEEFHQCQSQLLRLYKEGTGSGRFLEFTAYRLLYYIFTLDLLGINTIMAGLRPTHKSNPCIRFALDVRSAWSLHNYRRFFRLICPTQTGEQPPQRCARVLQWIIGRERKEAVKILFKVFRPNLSLEYVSTTIGFDSIEECTKFVGEEFSIPDQLLEPVDRLDCKAIWSCICQSAN